MKHGQRANITCVTYARACVYGCKNGCGFTCVYVCHVFMCVLLHVHYVCKEVYILKVQHFLLMHICQTLVHVWYVVASRFH